MCKTGCHVFSVSINICNLIVAEYNPSQRRPSFLFMRFLIYYSIQDTHNVLRYINCVSYRPRSLHSNCLHKDCAVSKGSSSDCEIVRLVTATLDKIGRWVCNWSLLCRAFIKKITCLIISCFHQIEKIDTLQIWHKLHCESCSYFLKWNQTIFQYYRLNKIER